MSAREPVDVDLLRAEDRRVTDSESSCVWRSRSVGWAFMRFIPGALAGAGRNGGAGAAPARALLRSFPTPGSAGSGSKGISQPVGTPASGAYFSTTKRRMRAEPGLSARRPAPARGTRPRTAPAGTAGSAPVATIRPPMIATAIGPKNTLRDSGIIASTAASAVSTIGRKRRTVASMIACVAACARRRCPARSGRPGSPSCA